MELHELEEYRSPDSDFPCLVPIASIAGALARKVVSVGTLRTKVWATIALDNVSHMFRQEAIV